MTRPLLAPHRLAGRPFARLAATLPLAFALAIGAVPLPGTGGAAPAVAQELPAGPDRQAILDVIGAQLDAFRRDDFATAYGFASPTIQRLFPSAERFAAMVTGAYRPVYRPREVRFLDMIVERGQPTQRVWLLGPDGKAVIAHYIMERQPDGSWKIDGVTLHEVDDLSV